MNEYGITILFTVIFRGVILLACHDIHYFRRELTAWRRMHLLLTEQGSRCDLRWMIRHAPRLLHGSRALMAIFPQGRLTAPCISHCAHWLGGSAHRPERWCDSLMPQASWCEGTLTAMDRISWDGPPLSGDIVSRRQSLAEYYYVNQLREYTQRYLVVLPSYWR